MALEKLVDVARSNGMECIDARRYGLCFFNQIALFGTPEAMRRTEKQWAAAGSPCEKRRPRFAFPALISLPRSEWLDTKLRRAGQGEARE